MKKILLALTFLMLSLNATSKPPKMGCILAQQGEVKLHWTVYGDKKLEDEANSTSVAFIPIKKEGQNFREILVGSSIKADFQGKTLLAKFLHIQSKKRIARGPRQGIVLFNISLNAVNKDVPMVYFYQTGEMNIKGHINLKDFNFSAKDTYVELVFDLHINSLVCSVPHRGIVKKEK
jgi:hypothetical protein